MNYYTELESPVGPLTLTSDGASLTGLFMAAHPRRAVLSAGHARSDDAAPFREAARQIEGYFSGGLAQFELPLNVKGTPFQTKVWESLRQIPYGTTISYAELARRMGAPGASRAVGRANALNPLCIVVPCHRVIGSSGRLTGYSGGLVVKERLLALEAACPLAKSFIPG